MSTEPQNRQPGRTVIIFATSQPLPVVFEMIGDTVEIPPFGELRLVVRGPETEVLRIGYGAAGISIYRDEGLEVEVFDQDGNPVDVGCF